MPPPTKKWFYDYETLHKITGVSVNQLRKDNSHGIFDPNCLESVILYIASRCERPMKEKVQKALFTDSKVVPCTPGADEKHQKFLEKRRK